MIADQQTWKDLELFSARDGGPSVLAMIDRTTTRAGRRRLEGILQRPLASAEEIQARQDAIRLLADRGIRFGIPDEATRAVRDYVDSNYVGLTRAQPLARRVEAIWIGLRYRKLVRHVRGGVRALRELAAAATRLVEAVAADDASTTVASLCAEVRSTAALLAPHASAADGSLWLMLEADRVLRGEQRDRIVRLLDALAELDALCSGATLLREEYTLPRIAVDGIGLEGGGVWHPFLPDGVRNPVEIRGGETLVFLTGPNMAGKTTYLRAVGVALYLAHCGLPVPAERLAFSLVDRLLTGLAPEDNLRTGTSYFLAEVRRVKQAVAAVASGERTVAIFDEVFRGTNVTDALEASSAVLRGCARASRSMFLVSSHLVELSEELESHPTIRFCCFEGELQADRVRFDYRLRNGVSRQRFGMELLRREGIPALLDSIPA